MNGISTNVIKGNLVGKLRSYGGWSWLAFTPSYHPPIIK